MKRILLTGATGFIGANLARHLLQNGHEIHALIRPRSNRWRIEDIQTDLHLYEVDLEDKERLTKSVLNVQPDWVFHLAAYGASAAQTDISQMVATNIVGTINLVEACLQSGFEVFVNTGSSSEYGFKTEAPNETTWLEPNSHYAVAKATATMFCRHTAQSRDVRLFTLRLYSVYGPYESATRLIPTLVRKGLKGELPCLASPESAHDFVYIEDVIDAYINCAAQPCQESGAIYNVGTGVQTSLREVVDTARRLLGITAEPIWESMPNRLWDSDAWVADIRKIEQSLSWQPAYSFERGFESTVNWFRANRHGSRRVFHS
jgi:nucleoside-diphosphate-sugar epimerase